MTFCLFCFIRCNTEDEDNIADETCLFGTWELVYEELNPRDGGDAIDSLANGKTHSSYEFYEDFTGMEVYDDGTQEKRYPLMWNLFEERGTLEILYTTFYAESLVIESLDEHRMVLQISDDNVSGQKIYDKVIK